MTAKYPVEVSDQEGIADALNYLLSGPAGLGQNFDGVSVSNDIAYLRPTFREPFTVPITTTLDPALYLSVPASDAVPVGALPTQEITVTFATPFTDAPFQFGDKLELANFIDDQSGLLDAEFDYPQLGSTDPSFYTFSGTKPALAAYTEYFNIIPTTLTGAGVGADIDVYLRNTGATTYDSGNTEIYVNDRGTGYLPGDTILILGTDIGGASPANDLTLTIDKVYSEYSGGYTVLSCTTTDVTLFSNGYYTYYTYVSGGDLIRDYRNNPVSTDANARISVYGPRDKVFVTAQVDVGFESITGTGFGTPQADLVVQINRYVGTPTQSLTDNDYNFNFQDTIAQKVFHFEPIVTPGIIEKEIVFTTVLDGPNLDFGLYWYLLEMSFVTKPRRQQGGQTGTSGQGIGPTSSTALGALISQKFTVTQLPTGTVGNIQDQTIPPGTAYFGITPINLTRTPVTPATVTVALYPNTYNVLYSLPKNFNFVTPTVTVAVTNLNTGYQVGDQLKILGTDIGGVSPDNDLYITVDQIDYYYDAIPGNFTLGLRSLTAQVIKE